MAGTTVLAPQVSDRDGAELNLTAANEDGHTIVNSGRMLIVFANGGSNCEVTIATPGLVDGLGIGDKVIDVVGGETWVFGPFPPDIYNTEEGVTDVITVTFEDHESMEIAAVIMPIH